MDQSGAHLHCGDHQDYAVLRVDAMMARWATSHRPRADRSPYGTAEVHMTTPS